MPVFAVERQLPAALQRFLTSTGTERAARVDHGKVKSRLWWTHSSPSTVVEVAFALAGLWLLGVKGARLSFHS
jgi:hypothetical protein